MLDIDGYFFLVYAVKMAHGQFTQIFVDLICYNPKITEKLKSTYYDAYNSIVKRFLTVL